MEELNYLLSIGAIRVGWLTKANITNIERVSVAPIEINCFLKYITKCMANKLALTSNCVDVGIRRVSCNIVGQIKAP